VLCIDVREVIPWIQKLSFKKMQSQMNERLLNVREGLSIEKTLKKPSLH
jgi:hypothetical protein